MLRFGLLNRPSEPVKARTGQKRSKIIGDLLRRFKGRLWRASDLLKK